MGAKLFGARVKRLEDPALLTGRGCYVDDMKLPDMLCAAFLRSPHPHARIRSVDKRAALAMPGVHSVWTLADLPKAVREQRLLESRQHPRAKRYPLLLVSNHGKWRVHAEHDDISWLREIPMCKVKGPDGYMYEPVWINPRDADVRGIKDGDIVKIYNERGAILSGARVTERIIPGALSQDHGARHDPICPGLDRGGSNNLLSPRGLISRNCVGVVTSGFLVEIEKVDLAKLRDAYPEAFERKYEPASGLLFDAWVVED